MVLTLSALAVTVTHSSVASAAPSGSVGVDHDQAGSSWYPDQTALTPQLVQGGTFGQLFATNLNGDIQAQPLVEDGVLLAETEGNSAYGLDPATGSVLWSRSLGGSFSSAALGCSDLPGVGVTGTPVVDTATNVEYFLSKVYVSGTSGPAQYWMHALSVTTGAEQPNFPVLISGTASNDPLQAFNATYQLQRPGLLLMNGVVYAAFGSHCDISPTHGWVVGVSEAGSVSTLWSSEAGNENGTGLGGIWSPGSLRSDGPGQLLFATGNGYSPAAPTAGHSNPPPGQLAEAVVRLTVQPDGSLKTTDFFVPLDANALNQVDGDLGSGSPMFLPSSFSTPTYPHLAVEMGKEGYLYILDATNLGGYEQGPNGGDNVLARIGPNLGVWGSTAVWGGDGGYLYVVTNGGTADGSPGYINGKLLAFKFGIDGAGKPTFALVGSSTDPFGYSSSSPEITSSGTTSGTSVLWVNWSSAPGATGAQLRAYNPVPDAQGNLDLLWSAPSGIAPKMTEPGIGGNRVYMGGYDDVLRGYGAPVQSPLAGGSLGFPNTTVSQSSTQTDVITANVALSVNTLSVSGPFGLGATSPAPLPISLTPGQTFSVPVTFTPTKTGIAAGVLTVNTSAGTYQVGLSGTGLSATAQLTAAPPTISYPATATGSTTTEDAVFTNEGSQSLTITGATLPAAPFTVGGLPATGTTLAPGASVSTSVSFSPTATGSFLDALTLMSDTGGSITVHLSGTAGSPAVLQVTPTTLNYGTAQAGGSVNATFVVTNTGGSPMAITKSKPPGLGEFTATTQLPEGTVLQAGQSVTESVTFAPTGSGSFTDTWPINGTGNSVLTVVTFTGNGTIAGAVDFSNWVMRGTAALAPAGASLTTTSTTFQAGSVTSPVAVSTGGLTVAFDAKIGGGTGANGMTLTFASPSSPTFLGQGGGSLGYSGIKGVAVGLSNYQQGTEPSANFVGIADGGPVTGGIPNWVATSSSIPTLQGATTHVVASVNGTQLTVWVAGVQVLSKVVADLPSSANLVFTAATGGLTDNFNVQNINVTHTNPYPLSPVLGGWSRYGNATLAGTAVSLTTTSSLGQSGSIVSPDAVPTGGLTVAFDAKIGGGTGANGMTLTFANPSSPTFLGGAGGNLGYSGISGVAVGLSNFQQAGDPSANFVGIADGGPVGSGIPNWVATSSSIPTLQGATTHVVVSVNGTHLTVWVAGVQVLQANVADLPSLADLVFTAGTGGLTDNFSVQNVNVYHSSVSSLASWTLNGNAAHSGSALSLTTSGSLGQSGSAVSPAAVGTNGLTVAFDANIGGGTGANGMTLTFANPSSSTFLGGAGGNLGYSGISGVAVGLSNFQQAGDPSANFVGIADGGPVGSGIPNWVATSSAIPTLQGATTHVVVSINGTQLTVSVAGVQVLQTNLPDLPSLADLVFTAGTGGLTDNFTAQNVAVTQNVLNPISNWAVNGNATISGSTVSLTTSTSLFEAGSVVSPTSVTTNYLSVAFDANIGGGTGANGMTLTFASPSSPTFLGQGGGSLGYSGIKGVAVGLSNFQEGSDPSANFVGIADGGPVSTGIPNWVATTSSIPKLQGGTTHVQVTVIGTQVMVWVASVEVLKVNVPDLPPVADLVLTAATGGLTDNFIAQNLGVAR
jgi:hypothetical protein